MWISGGFTLILIVLSFHLEFLGNVNIFILKRFTYFYSYINNTTIIIFKCNLKSYEVNIVNELIHKLIKKFGK